MMTKGNTMSEANLILWDSVEKTDPARTKNFSRGGGFKGTATNFTYNMKRATEKFGPCGIGYGWNVIDEKYQPGAGTDVIHIVRVKFWYMLDGKRGEVEQFGQTAFVGKNKNGPFTDEEAPKKSITDAVSKCLSYLGFSADIHMGMYDDNKYVSDLKREFREGEKTAANDDNSASGGESADDRFKRYEKTIIDCKTWQEVDDLLNSKQTKYDLSKMHEDDEKDILHLAQERMKELGFNKGGKAA
jgi:hypothetical protein